jgi:hypothetical protein
MHEDHIAVEEEEHHGHVVEVLFLSSSTPRIEFDQVLVYCCPRHK